MVNGIKQIKDSRRAQDKMARPGNFFEHPQDTNIFEYLHTDTRLLLAADSDFKTSIVGLKNIGETPSIGLEIGREPSAPPYLMTLKTRAPRRSESQDFKNKNRKLPLPTTLHTPHATYQNPIPPPPPPSTHVRKMPPQMVNKI